MNYFHTIKGKSEQTLFKDKGSKFFGYAFPLKKVEDIKIIIKGLKKEHNSARHWCYAWKLGYGEKETFRINDDGEPKGTAGQPIFNQIQSFELTNILVVSVRYFGGIKLGVSGLINAYKTSSKITLEQCNIIKKDINERYNVKGSYEDFSFIQRIIKELNIEIENQNLTDKFDIDLIVSKGAEKSFLSKAEENYKLITSKLD